MKRRSIVLLLSGLSTLALANGNFNLRVGADIHSKVDSLGKYSSGSTEDYGYEVGLEYLRPIGEKLELGIGVAYQKHAKISGKNQENESYHSSNVGIIEKEHFKGYHDFQGYDSVPVYLTGKYTLNKDWKFKPYLKGSIGYSFNFGNDEITYSDNESYENESTGVDGPGKINETYNLSTNIKHGLYYAAGIGIEYKFLSLEALYQINTGKLSVGNNEKYDSNYERVSLVLNYKF